MELIIQLISGAVGGNVAGKLLQQFNLGTLGNSIAGVLGGGIGGQLISHLTGMSAGGGGMDIGGIIGQIASGGVGGGVLLVIVGLVRKVLSN